jgi:hypothetical protein
MSLTKHRHHVLIAIQDYASILPQNKVHQLFEEVMCSDKLSPFDNIHLTPHANYTILTDNRIKIKPSFEKRSRLILVRILSEKDDVRIFDSLKS